MLIYIWRQQYVTQIFFRQSIKCRKANSTVVDFNCYNSAIFLEGMGVDKFKFFKWKKFNDEMNCQRLYELIGEIRTNGYIEAAKCFICTAHACWSLTQLEFLAQSLNCHCQQHTESKPNQRHTHTHIEIIHQWIKWKLQIAWNCMHCMCCM